MLEVSKILLQINKHLKITKLCRILDIQHHEYDDKISVCCCYHNDTSPSAFIIGGKFHCSSCDKHVFAISYFIAAALKNKKALTEDEALDLIKQYTSGQEKFIDPQFIELFHKELINTTSMQEMILKKGITFELIKKHRIGIHVHNKIPRFTIPVYDVDGYCEVLLSYLPDAKSHKFFNFDPQNKGTKHTSRIFLLDQFKYSSIVICGGPLKAIIAANELNQYDIGAISLTTGEGTLIPEEYRSLFRGKHVYVCYDIDNAGIFGAKRALQSLTLSTKLLYLLRLPLDIQKYPKGDLTNYMIDEKQLLHPLLSNPDYVIPYDNIASRNILPQDPKLTTFFNMVHGQKDINQLYQLDIKTIGIAEQVVNFTTKVQVNCTRDISLCAFCSIYHNNPDELYEIEPNSPIQVILLSPKESKHATNFRSVLGIPTQCKCSTFISKEVASAQECELSSPNLSVTEQSIIQRGYFINNTPPKNEIIHNIIGREVLDEGQQPVLLITECKKANDIFLSAPTHDEIEYIKTSAPQAWTEEALQIWYDQRYSYLALRHGIFGRTKMNFLIDLTFHSVLQFTFNHNLTNGWISMMILGDTGTGKSTMLKKLFELYKYGTLKFQATGSRAGWVGGLVKTNKGRMFYKPGVLPLNDGGLVCIEELKNLDEEILQSFITAMSDGFVEASFIQSQQSQARVRLIFTSNPRKSNTLNKEPSVNLMKALLGTEEAFRRIDCAYVTFKNKDFLEPRLTAASMDQEILPLLVQYAWSRTDEQIIFEDKTVELINTWSTYFIDKYNHPTLFLVDPSSQQNKFAKMAVACANLTGSIDNQNVIIRPCHINFIAHKLEQIYDGEELGYKKSVEHNAKYTKLEFDNPEILEQFISVMNYNLYCQILDNLHGNFDSNQFTALFNDAMIGRGIFAMCSQLGFIQSFDNKMYTITEKWRKYRNGPSN